MANGTGVLGPGGIFGGGGLFGPTSSTSAGQQDNEIDAGLDGLQVVNNTLGGAFAIGGDAKGGVTATSTPAKVTQPINPSSPTGPILPESLGVVNPTGNSLPILIGAGILGLVTFGIIFFRRK